MRFILRRRSGFRLTVVETFLMSSLSALLVFLAVIPFSGAVASAVHIGPTPPVPKTDLAVTVLDVPDPVESGEELTYTVTVSNLGPIEATNVKLSDDLPGNARKPSITFVSVATGQGTCVGPEGSGLKLTCSLGQIDPGGVVVITIVVEINPAARRTLNNKASVDASQGDLNRGNNRVTTITSVQR